MRPARCSPQRQLRRGRTPVRRRSHRRRHRFVPGEGSTSLSKRSSQAFGSPQPEPGSSGDRRRIGFPRVRPRRRRPDVATTAAWRACDAALKGCATGRRDGAAQRRRDIRPAPRCGQRAARLSASSGEVENRSAGVPSAEAPIRPRRRKHLVIQTILARRSDHPSRSRGRQAIAGGSVFRASGRGGAGRMLRRRGLAVVRCSPEGLRYRAARRGGPAAARYPTGAAMRPARCSPQRQLRRGRTPVRRRSHRRRHRFVPGEGSTSLSKRSSQGVRITPAGAGVVRRSPEDRFSARQAEAAPAGCCDAAAWRSCDAALKGCATGRRDGAAQRRRDIRPVPRCGQRAARLSASSGEVEHRSAGAPIGGGTDSSQAKEAPRYPNDPRKAFGSPQPEPGSSGDRRRIGFPRVRPRRRRPDVATPRPGGRAMQP